MESPSFLIMCDSSFGGLPSVLLKPSGPLLIIRNMLVDEIEAQADGEDRNT